MKTDNYKAILEAKRSQLAGSVNREEIEIERHADELDRIVQLSQREVSTLLLDQNARLLASVRAALRRIETGEFGVCINCEEEIPAKRLAAIPWAERCIPCQERHEMEVKNHSVLLQEEEHAA